MKKVVITGGTGFVGANLALHLVKEGHEVHMLVRSHHQAWRLADIRDHAQFYEVVLSDFDSVDRVLTKIKPDWLFHLAVHGAYSWQNNLDEMVTTNIQGTMNLVRAAMKTGFEAFVNTGSSSEYGFKNHPPTEITFLEPNSHYAVTKAAATMFCSFTARHHKLHIPTLRLYSIYGPFEDPNRLFPQLLVRGLKGQLPPLANPDIARDFVYIDDAVAAYLKAATVTGQEHGAVYNVGSGVQTTLRQVVEVAREDLQISSEADWGSMPAREWDSTCWVSEPGLIRQQLGWIPRFDLKAGFHAFAQWLRENPRWAEIYEKATQT